MPPPNENLPKYPGAITDVRFKRFWVNCGNKFLSLMQLNSLGRTINCPHYALLNAHKYENLNLIKSEICKDIF